MEVEVTSLCRICLEPERHVKNLSVFGQNSKLGLAMKIFLISGVQVCY